MDERVARLETAEECEQFALNVEDRLPELALQAKRRAVELRAAQHGARSQAEREALEAVYAYEGFLTEKHGKTTRANRTWQMIKRYGIIEAMERIVTRDDDPSGYRALAEMGMQDLAFEAVIVRHASTFSPEAVSRSEARLKAWQ